MLVSQASRSLRVNVWREAEDAALRTDIPLPIGQPLSRMGRRADALRCIPRLRRANRTRTGDRSHRRARRELAHDLQVLGRATVVTHSRQTI